MKLLLVVCLVGVCLAAPQSRDSRQVGNPQDVQLLKYESINDGLGSYRYYFEQSDGQKRQEQGELKNAGSESQYIAVSGTYSWTSPEGILYIIKYVADDNGYQPTVEQGPGAGVPAHVASILG